MAQLGERSSLDYSSATRAQFIAEVSYWQARALTAEEKAAKAEEKAAELASDLFKYEGWIANPSLQGNIPAVLIATHKAIARAQAQGAPTREGKSRVYRQDVANYAGCSLNTVSDVWRKLEKNGLLEKTVSSVHDSEESQLSTGPAYKRVAFVDIPRQVEANPMGVRITTDLQGGKRIPICKDCGSTDLKREVRITCCSCGSTFGQNQVIMVSEEFIEERAALADSSPEDPIIAPPTAIVPVSPPSLSLVLKYPPPLLCRSCQGVTWIENELRNRYQCAQCQTVSSYSVYPASAGHQEIG